MSWKRQLPQVPFGKRWKGKVTNPATSFFHFLISSAIPPLTAVEDGQDKLSFQITAYADTALLKVIQRALIFHLWKTSTFHTLNL